MIAGMGPRDPWQWARKEKRDYLTPEDLDQAARCGASRKQLMQAALQAIEAKRAEDVTLCAFIALYRTPGKDGTEEFRPKKTPWMISTGDRSKADG